MTDKCLYCNGKGFIRKQLICGCGAKINKYFNVVCPACKGRGSLEKVVVDNISELIQEAQNDR